MEKNDPGSRFRNILNGRLPASPPVGGEFVLGEGWRKLGARKDELGNQLEVISNPAGDVFTLDRKARRLTFVRSARPVTFWRKRKKGP